ncbi:hypothetical protein [Neobacillus rhizophilus]|uniref:Uncharacterized protein n=1 Tax=Neobacillus rhizophilus TaxID=2833579 RepID=A0A942YVL7_9BACI|nr:hypothetical protein [Neobacillus rhizophilus]MBS4215218.1 hypothetical protein [Neobacillus rhizophilus]
MVKYRSLGVVEFFGGGRVILIIDLLIDIAGKIIEHLIPNPTAKFEKNMIRLKDEAWFSELEKDYRYQYIIYNNRKVKRFLSNETNVKKIISMDLEREQFILLIKEEHEKFVGLRK